MTLTLKEAAEAVLMPGERFFSHQEEAFHGIAAQPGHARACLYFPTGKGKTVTALVPMALAGVEEVLVLAPPITHDRWIEVGQRLGITVEPISHAKFRGKDYKVSRHRAVIVDEFHLLGGHAGVGWKKLDLLARHLQAPLLILSATPNYNDAERVYCIMHVMDPANTKGGYLEFIYANCVTKANRFAMEPKVIGFQRYESAADFLADLPYVYYVPDEMNLDPTDITVHVPVSAEVWEYGMHARTKRIFASDMERRHALAYDRRVDLEGMFREELLEVLNPLVGDVSTPTLLFCASSKIAAALYFTLKSHGVSAEMVTGTHTKKVKKIIVDDFKAGKYDILIGTATLATGLDGVDKMCDQLIIVHDVDDNALRRQLIGRILPRGADSEMKNKRVYRLVLTD